MINGEIGIEIGSISIRKFQFQEGSYEMTFHDINGGFLHIVGDNDLKTLLEEALNNLEEK